jgi:uncharacterized protein (DUF488 family)
MAIYTAGFAEWSAEGFFGRLRQEGIDQIVDVRLRPASQLAGFAKSRDLQYFLRELCGARYRHELLLAPTAEMLDQYRKKSLTWSEYEEAFLNLMSERSIETRLDPADFSGKSVLLCSEHRPEKCHRRLVVEYLSLHWDDIGKIFHLT